MTNVTNDAEGVYLVFGPDFDVPVVGKHCTVTDGIAVISGQVAVDEHLEYWEDDAIVDFVENKAKPIKRHLLVPLNRVRFIQFIPKNE